MLPEDPTTPPVTAATPPEMGPQPEKPKGSSMMENEKLLAAIGYLPMLFVAPLIMKPKSLFCQMHAKQGMLITVLTFFVLIVLVAIPTLGSLLFLGLIGLIAIGAFQAYSGVEWKIPFLYEIAMKINVDKIFDGTGITPVSTETKPEAPQGNTPEPTEPKTPPSNSNPNSAS